MKTTFTYIRDGVPEEVKREKWGWIALYKDGSFLKQFDDESGIFHRFSEINLEELHCFVMQCQDDPQDVSKRYEIHIQDGMKPIHYYQKGKLKFGEEGEVAYTLYCFGFEQLINGQTAKTIMTIYPKGVVSIKNE